MDTVTVEYGVNSQDMNLAGKTIAEAIQAARLLWVLPEDVTVRLNYNPVEDDSTVLQQGDTLELVKPSGDKGQ